MILSKHVFIISLHCRVNLFDNPENGGHPDATKAVVIIDGSPKDATSMASLKVNGISTFL